MDSTTVLQHAPYKVQPKVRVESPMGAIEVDSGNSIIDGSVVVLVIVALYVCKKLVDKYLKK